MVQNTAVSSMVKLDILDIFFCKILISFIYG